MVEGNQLRIRVILQQEIYIQEDEVLCLNVAKWNGSLFFNQLLENADILISFDFNGKNLFCFINVKEAAEQEEMSGRGGHCWRDIC